MIKKINTFFAILHHFYSLANTELIRGYGKGRERLFNSFHHDTLRTSFDELIKISDPLLSQYFIALVPSNTGSSCFTPFNSS